HGLYFAEEQAVADYYRGLATAGSPEEKYALRAVRDQGSIAAAIADLRDALKRNIELGRFDHVYRGALDVLERWQRDGKALPQGHLYRVRIAADPEHFLDWDKPLSDQSEAVQSALRSLGVDPATASLGEAFNVIGGERDRLVAEKLHAAGVPGIKYLDEGSRAGPELRVEPLGFGTDKFQLVDAQGRQVPGTFETRAAAEEALKRFRQTRNYVVFDDKLISITHKNGEPVRQAELPGRLHALSADARQWPALPEGARMVGHGDHGPILEGFRSWGDALSWLKAAQTGEVRGLLRHRDVPAPIDVVWGRATAKDAAGNVVQRGYGLAHIIADHPELDVARLPELLAQMREVPSPVRGRIRLESDRYGAALSPEWEGVRKHWVITAFGLRGKSGGKGEGGGPGGEPGPRPAADLQAPLSRYYGEEGAGPTESLESRAGADKPDWQSLAGAPEWRQFADAPAPYEDPQLVAESKEAEREPAPPAEPAQAVSAAEKAAQAADKILADMLPTLSDEERMQIDEALQQLDRDHEERGAIIKEGAACLAAAAA
ncbi:MAG TPA: hypothetical protein VJ747_02385, partial [Stellaceae bacterium]|nr:hypothetical protein [Stellaceae bacterium]